MMPLPRDKRPEVGLDISVRPSADRGADNLPPICVEGDLYRLYGLVELNVGAIVKWLLQLYNSGKLSAAGDEVILGGP